MHKLFAGTFSLLMALPAFADDAPPAHDEWDGCSSEDVNGSEGAACFAWMSRRYRIPPRTVALLKSVRLR